jgi:hypothetical protein
MWRGDSTYFSIYTSPTPNAASASRCRLERVRQFADVAHDDACRGRRRRGRLDDDGALMSFAILMALSSLDGAVAAGKNGHAGLAHHARARACPPSGESPADRDR